MDSYEGVVAPDNSNIKHAYADYLLSYSWDFFITQTFRTTRHDGINASLAVWNTLESKFNSTRAFIAVERNYLDGIHLHLLSRHVFNPQLKASSVWKYLYKAYGRNSVDCKVESANSPMAVSRYCAKYVIKGDYEYQFFGDKNGWILDNL